MGQNKIQFLESYCVDSSQSFTTSTRVWPQASVLQAVASGSSTSPLPFSYIATVQNFLTNLIPLIISVKSRRTALFFLTAEPTAWKSPEDSCFLLYIQSLNNLYWLYCLNIPEVDPITSACVCVTTLVWPSFLSQVILTVSTGLFASIPTPLCLQDTKPFFFLKQI